VEPKNSAALLGREPGLHVIQGIGDGFVPDVVDRKAIDMVMTVSDEDAIEMTRRIATRKACSSARRPAPTSGAPRTSRTASAPSATVLPDRAERYFSTALI